MKNDFLRAIFYKKIAIHGASVAFVNHTFDELLKAYTNPKRHYHDLNHIVALLNHAENYKFQINQFDTLFFAIWFHDAIYDSLKSDNEFRSAEWAIDVLTEAKFPKEQMDKVFNYINATATHIPNGDSDLNYFLDFDLSILGADPTIYDIYATQIRAEYTFYPNFLYNRGRKKILKAMLEKPFLFQTQEFRDKYETQARENIQREIENL